MNVSAALYRAGSSVSRGGVAMPRIMSPPGASRRVELDVRIHHLRMLALQPVAHAREQPRQRGAVLVEDGSERGVPQLLQEPAHRYALLARRVPCLSHRDAEREGLEDHREGQHDEADPDRAELLRVRESLVRLVHREDAAAEEQKERDDQRPEVALLAVTEWVPLRRGLHASADADVQKDMVAGV